MRLTHVCGVVCACVRARLCVNRSVLKYFDYTEVLEFTDEEVVAYSDKKPCILVVCPHGVISYTGICSGIADAGFGLPLRRKVLSKFPTAVASVVLKFPILKHVVRRVANARPTLGGATGPGPRYNCSDCVCFAWTRLLCGGSPSLDRHLRARGRVEEVSDEARRRRPVLRALPRGYRRALSVFEH